MSMLWCVKWHLAPINKNPLKWHLIRRLNDNKNIYYTQRPWEYHYVFFFSFWSIFSLPENLSEAYVLRRVTIYLFIFNFLSYMIFVLIIFSRTHIEANHNVKDGQNTSNRFKMCLPTINIFTICLPLPINMYGWRKNYRRNLKYV